jgi:hypothetical protein
MVSEGERDCIDCLEMGADQLMKHLISGELANYRVVPTSPEPLQLVSFTSLIKSRPKMHILRPEQRPLAVFFPFPNFYNRLV